MDKITHEVRMAQWKEIICQCQARPEGQSQAAWMAENGISSKQYYYWQRRIRREAYAEMPGGSLPATRPEKKPVTFAEIPIPQQPSPTAGACQFQPDAVICLGNVTVAVANSASGELLQNITQAVQHAC